MDFANRFLDAVACDDVSRVQHLLAAEPRLSAARDRQGRSALLLAAYHGHEELTLLLAAELPSLDIFEASVVGDVRRVTEILDEEPDALSRTSADGFHPLGLAAFFGHRDVVQELVARGADADAPSANALRVRPLHSALARAGPTHAYRIARVLLDAGADPDARQDGGLTPLHTAAARGLGDVAALLLERGADPGSVADDRRTPADLARERGHEELARLLAGGANT